MPSIASASVRHDGENSFDIKALSRFSEYFIKPSRRFETLFPVKVHIGTPHSSVTGPNTAIQ